MRKGWLQAGVAVSELMLHHCTLPKVTPLPARGHGRSQRPSGPAKATRAPQTLVCGRGTFLDLQAAPETPQADCALMEQTPGQGTRALGGGTGQEQPRNVCLLFQCSWPH